MRTASPLTRRQALAGGGAALAGGGAALAGCGGGEPAATASSAPAPPAADESALAQLQEVPVGSVVVVAGGTAAGVAVARPSEEEVVAFDATCTHQGCAVEPAGAALSCPCHGSRFHAFTGRVLRGPAETPLQEVAVQVRDGAVVRSG